MTVDQVFYYTGLIIWLLVSISFIAALLTACISAPFIALAEARRVMWQWKYADEVVATGLSQKELQYALTKGEIPEGYNVKTMLAWVESVKMQQPLRKEVK